MVEYVERNFGVSYDPATECIITVGVSEALDLALRAMLNSGDEVVYHEPCYVSYSPCVRLAQGSPVVVPTFAENGFSLAPGDLRMALTPRTKALMLNFPCNPTGASMDSDALSAIARLSIERDLLVITDEIYSELTYEGEHVTIASLPGMRDRTLLLHGFSKAYAMTGFRIGFACGPADLIDAMMKVHQYSMLCAPTIAQEAAVEALDNAWSDMEEMRDEYHLRRNMIVRRLNAMGLTCVSPKGAFYVFPSVGSTGLSSSEFATRLLKERNVAVVPGTAFGHCGEGFVRCSYAASLDSLNTAMDRMEAFLESLGE